MTAPTFRAFDPVRDYGPVAELICEANRHDGTEWLPDAETLRVDLTHDGTFRPDLDGCLGEIDGRLAGAVMTMWRRRGDKIVHRVDLTVRPGDRRHGLGAALLEWAERHEAERARDGDAGPIELAHEIGGWADDAVAGPPELAAAHGYRVVRYGMDMLRPIDAPIPDAPLPEGIEIRPVVPADHRRIWEADVEAFADHWEAAARTESDFEWWFTLPILDTSLWQVAWDGDEVVGGVWTMIDPDENARLGVNRAWLNHVSVRRPWRRRGIAASLIASTLRLLAERGVEQAGLGVDAENTSGAVRLYERMGFVRNHTGAHYRKSLAF